MMEDLRLPKVEYESSVVQGLRALRGSSSSEAPGIFWPEPYSLQPAQKLGLLGGKLFLGQDAFALQFSQALDLCEDIHFLGRLGAVRLGWRRCLCRGALSCAIDGDDGQARD